MIPFMQSSRKCKLIYSDRKISGCLWIVGSGKGVHRGTRKLLRVIDMFIILIKDRRKELA